MERRLPHIKSRIDEATPVKNKIPIRGNSTEYEMPDRKNISKT